MIRILRSFMGPHVKANVGDVIPAPPDADQIVRAGYAVWEE